MKSLTGRNTTKQPVAIQETTGLLNSLKQHSRLAIKVSSNTDHFLPEKVLKKLLQPHRKAHYFFLFVNKGSATHKIDLKDFTVSDGELLFMLPNQIHAPAAKKSHLDCYKLSIDQSCLALLPQPFLFLINPFNTQVITFDDATKRRVKTIFETLNQLLRTDEHQADTEIILAHLNTLLTEFNHAYLKNINQHPLPDSNLEKFIAFKITVETQLTEQHSIHTIAEKLSITTSNLYGIVKAFAGISPKEYITNRLILEAKRKLHYSPLSVKELAYELGFNDPAYFSRLFKKNTGKSISRYLADLQDLSGN